MVLAGGCRIARSIANRFGLASLLAGVVSLLPNVSLAQPRDADRITRETWNSTAWLPLLRTAGDSAHVPWANNLRTAFLHFARFTPELPEADDEQLLPNECSDKICDPSEYSPALATIFPTDVLGKWTTLDFENAGADGIPVAEICSAEPYAPLGIQTTMPSPGKCVNPNTLFIALRNGTWSALMFSITSAGDVYTPLEVDRATFETDKICTTKPGYCDSDIPAVARFDWIRKHATISVRCGEGWCDVVPNRGGAPDGKAEKPETGDSTRNVRVKGWHDRQRLMSADKKPRGPTLTVAPNDTLGKIGLTKFLNTWLTVAYINRPANYKEITDDAGQKRPLIRGGQYKRNDIQIMATDPNDPTKWYWRMVYVKQNDDKEISNWTRSVKRTVHQTHPVPATARWRWKPDDEGIWVRCANGCCELQF